MDQDLVDFCRAEHPRLVGALSLYCRDRAVAEELAQEALLRVVTHWHKVRRLEHPSAWAYRVAINLATSYLRRRVAERRATRRWSSRAGAVHGEPDTPTAVAVRTAMAGLPHRQRAVLVLRFFLDLSVREVSDLLGYPEGTVKTLTARALASLRTTGLIPHPEVTDVR